MFDVTNHQSCVDAIELVRGHMKSNGLPFAALVNNAGVSRRYVAEFQDLNDARSLFETNFFGMVDLTQLALPLLRQNAG